MTRSLARRLRSFELPTQEQIPRSSTSGKSARSLNTLSTRSFSRTPNWHLSQENTESFDETDRLFHWRVGQERLSQSPADVGRKARTGGGVVSSASRRADSARRAVG